MPQRVRQGVSAATRRANPFFARLRRQDEKIEYGDIAQLVERLNGIQEVMGSIPTISTNALKIVLKVAFYHSFRGCFFAFTTAFSPFRANLV